MLVPAASQLATNSSVQSTTGADAQIIEANSERNAIEVQAATANSAAVFLTLVAPATTTPAASAASAHVELAAGQTWPGLVGGTLWLGRVRAFSAAAQVVRITEV
jgi:mRNA-degrading endonuclease toxin of MazEF toxin-antitoxin module